MSGTMRIGELRTNARALAGIIGDGMFAGDLGPKMTCTEAEVLADIARAVGQDEAADAWIAAHAEFDEEGDLHFEGARPGDGDSEGLTGRDG